MYSPVAIFKISKQGSTERIKHLYCNRCFKDPGTFQYEVHTKILWQETSHHRIGQFWDYVLSELILLSTTMTKIYNWVVI